jgi:hypothetical protein
MKKLLLIIAVILLGFNVTAQDTSTSDNGFRFGVKAGVNFSDITGKDVSSYNGRTSFHAGVVSEVMISDKFAFQPELLYSSQGSDYDDEGYSGTVTLDYLNIPLMAKYYVSGEFSLEAGPQIGFLMSAKDDYGSGEDDIKDYLKSTDFGLNFGVGYKLESGLNFGARYNLGLSDLNDSDFDQGSSVKNSVIQVSIGYMF